MIPTREEAHRILEEAEACNPGPWGDHSRVAAMCACKIAAASGMDPEKAYVFGLLHDIGRRFGRGHMMHVYCGWRYMLEKGDGEVARICVSHSFPVRDFDIFIGNRDIPEHQQAELRKLLSKMEYDDYDRLIQLCDGLGAAEGVVNVEDRMRDVKRRYGSYPQAQWDAVMALKAYFEEKSGRDIYETVK